MRKKKMWKYLLIIGFLVPFLTLATFNFAAFVSAPLHIGRPFQIDVVNDKEETIYARRFNGYGDYIPLKNIAESMQKSLICAEDQKFYKHFGFDYMRIAASAWQNMTKKSIVSGGSTITQQYARTLFLNNDKTLKRKINEAIITRKMEMSMSKNDILEGYLNSAYFGHNIYGIDQASYYFFNKTPGELSWGESALLSGILSAPNVYSPVNDYDLAMKKKEQVLRRLYEAKQIDASIYNQAIAEELQFNFQKKDYGNNHILYFHDAMMNEVKRLGYADNNTFRKGLRINSTLNAEVMNSISQVINKYNIDSQEQEVAVVVMKPNSGDVLGLAGGVDYDVSPYNRALNAKRQTGSAIKPLLYYLALENGLTPLTLMKSEPTSFYINDIGLYAPQNANNVYANRDINMVEAIANSDNIYATKTTLLIGSETLKEALMQFGVEDAVANPTIGLGSNSMSPLQLASIYNCFASLGNYYKPRFVKEISTPFGDKIKNANPRQFKLDETKTLVLNHLLRSPFDKALATYTTPSLAKYQTKNKFAAKTGSTDFDSWVAGFNPNYTIVVYVGNDENEPLKNGSLAKQIFVDIANQLTAKDPNIFFAPNKVMRPFTMTNPSNRSQSFIYYY